MTKNKLDKKDFFLEKHNAYYKPDGTPDHDCFEAKEGLYQYRITTSHFQTKEKAEQALSEIQQVIDDAEKWRITRRSGDSSVLIPCETLDELKEKAEKWDKRDLEKKNFLNIRDKLVKNHCEGILDETGNCKHCNVIVNLSKIIGDFP